MHELNKYNNDILNKVSTPQEEYEKEDWQSSCQTSGMMLLVIMLIIVA